MADLQSMLADYASALEAGLAEMVAPLDRSYCFERLSAVVEVAAAIAEGQFGRAGSILNEESRVVGWQRMPGLLAEVSGRSCRLTCV